MVAHHQHGTGLGNVFQTLKTPAAQQPGERVEHRDAQPDGKVGLLACHANLLVLLMTCHLLPDGHTVTRSLPCGWTAGPAATSR
jgi:hypothetical protein